MTYTAKVKLIYDSTWVQSYNSTLGQDFLPEEHVVYEFPVEDATTYQLFRAFGKFMLMIGHCEETVAKGAASVAFNEERSTEQMKNTAECFDLILSEDYGKKVIPLENKIYALEEQIRDLKAKLSRYENPDNTQYTEEEMDAMTFEDMQQAEEEWERIKKGPMGTVLTDEEDEGFEVDTTLDDVWPDGSPGTGAKY